MRLPFLRTKSAAPAAGRRIPSWASPLVEEGCSYASQVQAAFLANPVAARAIRMVTESAGGAPVVSTPAGQLHLRWIAQSRAGFGWPDLTDVPIGESRLAFRAVLRDAAGIVAEAELNVPSWVLADRAGPLWLDVAQVGATMGPVATLPKS